MLDGKDETLKGRCKEVIKKKKSKVLELKEANESFRREMNQDVSANRKLF